LARCPECPAASYASCITVSEAPFADSGPRPRSISVSGTSSTPSSGCSETSAPQPQHAEPIDALTLGIERAFDGRHFWRPFVREVRAADIEALDLWLEAMDPV
jgi:hypothetical protein